MSENKIEVSQWSHSIWEKSEHR